ncbi:hypothetical protein [Pseudomaricurvus sp. HS19]|uniref:hypothetical protein n=1 Tax=Pseudomaricurvus sp. HS19 TaxID=2692626 RepID=UPI00136C6813|nr:hypothetical protein [Pseudomaricurvus sp. HS19]MYM64884.1 hypothetical protein [Pseudomaricurvus sp. HS19]
MQTPVGSLKTGRPGAEGRSRETAVAVFKRRGGVAAYRKSLCTEKHNQQQNGYPYTQMGKYSVESLSGDNAYKSVPEVHQDPYDSVLPALWVVMV